MQISKPYANVLAEPLPLMISLASIVLPNQTFKAVDVLNKRLLMIFAHRIFVFRVAAVKERFPVHIAGYSVVCAYRYDCF